ncbi:MAG: hypothetical protein JRG71_12230 [Deltaproteobacteria bacterium]|nr:hypothetical protein [Deltaproteobacteria bacterium]
MSERSRHSCCPECHSREGYRLGDGRRKCCRCGKKYSRRHLRSRLSAKILKQIALYFWLGAPIVTVAVNLHLDRKTVCRHYGLIQQGINADEKKTCRLACNDNEDDVFCLLVDSGTTWCERVSNPPRRHVRVQSIDYCWCYSALISLEISLMVVRCFVYVDQNTIEGVSKSWGSDLEKFEKIVQEMCRKKKERSSLSQQLLITEAVFRFNQRNNPGVTAILYRYLRY